MINIPDVSKLSFGGNVEVSLPPNALSIDQSELDAVMVMDDKLASERIVSIGFDHNDNAVVLNGTLETWVSPLSKLLEKQISTAVPIMQGRYVLMLDSTGTYFVVDSLSIILNSTSAYGSGLTVTPT